MSHKRERYSSDVAQEQWELLKPLLPLEQAGTGRPLELDMREVVNAILYIVRTGTQWANMPHEFPNPNSVYYHYRKGCTDHTWQTIHTRLRESERQQRGRKAEPSAALCQDDRNGRATRRR